MRAALRDPGGPAGVRVVELPDPDSPGPGHVLVRMKLAPINPADRLVIADGYRPMPPADEIVGAEGMGVVEETGPGVTGIEIGDRVMLMARGNWTSWRIVEAGNVVRLPASISDVQSSMLRINPATAWRLLERLSLRSGQWLIQNAAGSSVARWVRILAASRGIGTVNIHRGQPPASEGIFLADGDDLEHRVNGLEVRGGLDAGIDAVAGEATGRLAACVAAGAEILVYGHLSGRPCTVPSTLLTSRGLHVSGFSLRPAEVGEAAADTHALYDELAKVATQAPETVAAIYPLVEIEAALSTAAESGRRGRVLLALD